MLPIYLAAQFMAVSNHKATEALRTILIKKVNRQREKWLLAEITLPVLPAVGLLVPFPMAPSPWSQLRHRTGFSLLTPPAM